MPRTAVDGEAAMGRIIARTEGSTATGKLFPAGLCSRPGSSYPMIQFPRNYWFSGANDCKGGSWSDANFRYSDFTDGADFADQMNAQFPGHFIRVIRVLLRNPRTKVWASIPTKSSMGVDWFFI
jgi:hypothetical protein